MRGAKRRSNLTTAPEQARPRLHACTTSAAADLPHAPFVRCVFTHICDWFVDGAPVQFKTQCVANSGSTYARAANNKARMAWCRSGGRVHANLQPYCGCEFVALKVADKPKRYKASGVLVFAGKFEIFYGRESDFGRRVERCVVTHTVQKPRA